MDAELWKVFWSVQLSGRYHEERQGFLDSWHNSTSGLSLFLGASAGGVALHAEWAHGAAILAFIIAIISAFDLSIGTQRNARKHHELRKQYLRLEADIFAARAGVTADDISKFEHRRLMITANESPQFHVLNFLCENELRRANGEDAIFKIPWLLELSAQFFRWPRFHPKPLSVPLTSQGDDSPK